ncbi:MAG: phenylacetic acid degradation bifunctional protein PaaZ [Bacteroidia bacterium]|nr:phenylacetic acid degradation bifunctional protein PaaZ [Bacteroidia bacterium]
MTLKTAAAKPLENYTLGQWKKGEGEGQLLFNAITGEPLATASSAGLDFGAMCEYARKTGGSKLRKLTFHERGQMLKALALHLMKVKEKFYSISWATGATRSDSWVDIEGGIGNLFAYASLRRTFPNETFCLDGDIAKLSKQNTFIGHHLCVPKEGVAIHINAFNFPVWGMLEKVAVNWLAGVPAIVKPATLTSYLTEAVVREIVSSGILPAGALQLICGSANGILDHVISQDVVTFTGSAATGKALKSHRRIIEESVPFNMEADSLNCCVMGPDVSPDKPEFDIFIKEVVREITTKAGQKCTAVRRIIVPENRVEEVRVALGKRLAGTVIGDPQTEGVRMGSLAGQSQRKEVMEKVEQLSRSQKLIIGDFEKFEVKGADRQKGAFMPPVIFFNPDPFNKTDCHSIEAFGPVSTLMPYNTLGDAVELAKLGKGSLVSSIVTADEKAARAYVLNAASMHGRVMVLNEECARESTGHGSPLPMLVHGGPGRAGGGEEMGGRRGVFHYLQRTAIQGSPTMLSAVSHQYLYGGKYTNKDVHPFRCHFEELEPGDTLITDTHTVKESDITEFAALSGDRFYAHLQPDALGGTVFKRTVAHGYFILSRAAGLFVDPPKGPVLLNYGIDDCRFTKPIYPGMSIGVRFTCKEKIENDKPLNAADGTEVKTGIVKWVVDVFDASPQDVRDRYNLEGSTGDTVAIATILTMVRKKNQ